MLTCDLVAVAWCVSTFFACMSSRVCMCACTYVCVLLLVYLWVCVPVTVCFRHFISSSICLFFSLGKHCVCLYPQCMCYFQGGACATSSKERAGRRKTCFSLHRRWVITSSETNRNALADTQLHRRNKGRHMYPYYYGQPSFALFHSSS